MWFGESGVNVVTFTFRVTLVFLVRVPVFDSPKGEAAKGVVFAEVGIVSVKLEGSEVTAQGQGWGRSRKRIPKMVSELIVMK